MRHLVMSSSQGLTVDARWRIFSPGLDSFSGSKIPSTEFDYYLRQ